MGMKWSDEQLPVFDQFKNFDQHLNIEATAGSGKTSTIIQGLNYVPSGKRSAFLSFANVIVDELKERVPVHVKASTLHSMGRNVIVKNFGPVKLAENKSFKNALATFNIKNKQSFTDSHHISRLVDFARLTYTPLDVDSIDEMANTYGLDTSKMEYIEKAIQILSKKYKSVKEIDYIDMLYLPVVMKLKTIPYDLIALDEAQDCSVIQLELLKILMHKESKLVSVGDPYQSIYSFAGADIHSFDRLKEKDNTLTLPLSTSYRCPVQIVNAAQRINPNMRAANTAKEGVVRIGDVDEVKSGDFILSRTNAPLVKLFFYFLDNKKRAKIMGKEIHNHFKQLAEQIAQASTKVQALNILERKSDRVFTDLSNLGYKNPQEHKKYIEAEESRQIGQILLRHVTYPAEVPILVDKMFSDERGHIVLTTIHKAKGLENERVFVIDHFDDKKQLPHAMATTHDAKVQETHLDFVSITRAKSELIYLNLTSGQLFVDTIR